MQNPALNPNSLALASTSPPSCTRHIDLVLDHQLSSKFKQHIYIYQCQSIPKPSNQTGWTDTKWSLSNQAPFLNNCKRCNYFILTVKSSPIVSYCRWIFSARSSKSLTMDGFSRDIALLSPEETIAGQVWTMQSQSWRFARHTPLWFPRRQYKAP